MHPLHTFSFSVILKMITTSMKAQQALENDYLLTENDLESRIEKIPHKLLDSNVSITRIKKYVTDGAWRLLIQLKKKLEKREWECRTCNEELEGEAVGCDVCLDWFHLACIGRQKIPKTKHWICRACYKV